MKSIFAIYLVLPLLVLLLAKDEIESCCRIEDYELQNWGHFRYFSHKFLIVVGAQKAGTTLLFNLISKHLQISTPISRQGRTIVQEGWIEADGVKELHFFDQENDRSFKDYLKSFDLTGLIEGKTLFEATPSYILSPMSACGISSFLPNAKLILIVKSPEERALSSYKMSFFKACQRNNKCDELYPKFYRAFRFSVEREIKNISNSECDLLQRTWLECYGCKWTDGIVKRGLYAPQILSWLQFVKPEQMLIVNHKETGDLQKLANKVWTFANLEPYQVNTSRLDGFVGKSVNHNSELEDSLQVLREFYTPYNQLLTKIMQERFNVHSFAFN